MSPHHRYLALPVMLFFLACDKGVEAPFLKYPIVTERDYRALSLKLVGYDSVRITHKYGIGLRSPEVRAVGVGIKGPSGYSELANSKAIYNEPLQVFYYSFDFTLGLDSSKISSPITVRYYLASSTFVDVDTTVDLYAFPYDSTKVILKASEAQVVYFQDVARIDNSLFFHPTGSAGLFEYNLVTNSIRTIIPIFGGGDHIAADSIYVFCDFFHNWVRRYNLIKDSLDLLLASFPQTSTIAGLEAYEGFLYVMLSYPTYHLKKYTYDGTLVDSIPFSRVGYHLTIHNGVLYNVSWGRPDQLQRFDLNSKTFLPNVKAPSFWVYGIKAYGDYLYFCSSRKKFLGCVPISQLN